MEYILELPEDVFFPIRNPLFEEAIENIFYLLGVFKANPGVCVYIYI